MFSLLDLRMRVVPFIEVFFGLAAFVAFPNDRLHVTALILAVIWGVFRCIPSFCLLPFLFYPPSWPTLIIGFGVRKRMIGQADLYALALVGVLFPFPAMITSLLGFEVWRRWWISRGNCGLIPALPGLFLGLAAYNVVQLIWSRFFI